MSPFRTSALAAACVVSLASSSALAWGAGVEVGGIDAVSNNLRTGSTTAGSATFGVILEQPFHLIPLLILETWEDFQTPLNVQVGYAASAQYWAVDVGARLGLDLGLFIPYVGIVGQLLILSSTPQGSPPLNSTVWGLGGDIGLDLSLVFIKIGAELRYVESLSPIPVSSNAAGQNSPSSVSQFEFLGSLRLSI